MSIYLWDVRVCTDTRLCGVVCSNCSTTQHFRAGESVVESETVWSPDNDVSEVRAWWVEQRGRWCLPQRHSLQPSASTWSSRRCSRTGGSGCGRGSCKWWPPLTDCSVLVKLAKPTWRAAGDTCSLEPPRSGDHGSSWDTWRTRLGNLCREPPLESTSSSRWSSRTSVSWWRPSVPARADCLCWNTWGRSPSFPCRHVCFAQFQGERW